MCTEKTTVFCVKACFKTLKLMYKGNKQINIELNSSDDKVSEFSGNKTNFQKNNRIRQKLQMMQKTLKMMSDTKTTKSN